MADPKSKIYFDGRLWDLVDFDDPIEFDQVSRAICRKWEGMKAGCSLERGRHVAWLEGVSYRLFKDMIERDFDIVAIFERRCSDHGRAPTAKSAHTNLFQKGLSALFAHDWNAITPRDRERIGKRLWHAFRHFVPPEFLAGFLAQIPSEGLLKRAAANEIEPGFESWVIEKLKLVSGGTSPEKDLDPGGWRGTYPSQNRPRVKSRRG